MISQEIKDAIKNIRPLSPALVRLLQTTAIEDHALNDVLEVIQLDTVLTANVLRVANSAAFRKSSEVNSIQMAVSLLGERTVVGLAMDLCAGGFFNKRLPGYESEPGDLWRNSIKTAIAARLLCQHARTETEPNLAFTAGILHDIGKVVLSAFLAKNAAKLQGILNESEQQALSFLDAEHRILGCDHCEAGVELAKEWKLPECYRIVIMHHHKPNEAPAEWAELVYAVHMGDMLAMMVGAGTGADTMRYALHPGHKQYFDLTGKLVERILLEMEQEYEKLDEASSE